MFGGTFDNYAPERGAIVFTDNAPSGFVHYVEWRTTLPVTVHSFALYAANDAINDNREFATFRLLAKSPGSSTFDLTLYVFSPTHPYTYLNPTTRLLAFADIATTTAQEFRAEFLNLNGRPAPRILELDAFPES